MLQGNYPGFMLSGNEIDYDDESSRLKNKTGGHRDKN